MGWRPNSLVWCKGMTGWEKAKDVPELAYLLEQIPNVAPPLPPVQPAAYHQPPYSQQYGQYSQYPQQQYGQPQYGYGQYQQNDPFNKPPKPNSYLVWAILSILYCCLPLGIVSIIYSAKVDNLYNSGDYEAAEQASQNAKRWAIASCVCAIVIYVFLVLFIGVFTNWTWQ